MNHDANIYIICKQGEYEGCRVLAFCRWMYVFNTSKLYNAEQMLSAHRIACLLKCRQRKSSPKYSKQSRGNKCSCGSYNRYSRGIASAATAGTGWDAADIAGWGVWQVMTSQVPNLLHVSRGTWLVVLMLMLLLVGRGRAWSPDSSPCQHHHQQQQNSSKAAVAEKTVSVALLMVTLLTSLIILSTRSINKSSRFDNKIPKCVI